MPALGPIAATVGFALFLRTSPSFWRGTFWFTVVQLVQLYWFVGHPFLYIYIAYVGLAFLVGLQFGLICCLRWNMFALSGLWVFLEWGRLYFFSGYTWNPVGLSLACNIYSLQFASLAGVYGMSFWVMLTNFLALRGRWVWFALAALTPYLYGIANLARDVVDKDPVEVALVQTGFPVEESLGLTSMEQFTKYVLGEWRDIVSDLKSVQGRDVDMIVLPELTVPFDLSLGLFAYEEVEKTFREVLGENYKLPRKEPHLAVRHEGQWRVNNAFWAQALADTFNAELIAGFEEHGKICYNTAYLFCPQKATVQVYKKRVLVPLGEYIPFDWLKRLAANYGVTGSFGCGKEATVLYGTFAPIGVSICYEETFGSLMRESRQAGAKLFVNLTNDGWYTGTNLPRQHLEHARLRTVENGVSLVRSCNTGVTCVIDAFGRDLARFGNTPEEEETAHGVLLASVSRQNFTTPYLLWGDSLILTIAALSLWRRN